MNANSTSQLRLEEQVFSFLWSNPEIYYQLVKLLSIETFTEEKTKKMYCYLMQYKDKIDIEQSSFNREAFYNFVQVMNHKDADYLREITSEFVSLTELKGCVDSLQEKETQRKLNSIGVFLKEIAKKEELTSDQRISLAKKKIDELIFINNEELTDIKESTHYWIAELERKPEVVYEPFLPALREILSSYVQGQITTIGAIAGGGKTQFLLNQLAYTAYVQKLPVLYVTPEMTDLQVMSRLMALMSYQKDIYGIPHSLPALEADLFNRNKAYLLKNNISNITPKQKETIAYLRDYVFNAIDDVIFPRYCPRGTAYPIEIETWIHSIKRKTGKTPLVIIDYFQLLNLPAQQIGNNSMTVRVIDKETDKLAEISGQLMRIAKSTNTVILTGAQITAKQIENNAIKDKRPSGTCIFNCSKLHQDSATVIYLHREEHYRKDKTPPEMKGVIELIIDKGRESNEKTIKAKADFAYSSIVSLDNRSSYMMPVC